jgi:glycosyltransferase involved in cell wall biosynthesis
MSKLVFASKAFFYTCKQFSFEFALNLRWLLFKWQIPFSKASDEFDDTLILSMTTYPKRVKYASKALKSVIIQNTTNARIVVYAYSDEYSEVFRKLSVFEKYNVRIESYPHNFRQYLKLIPSLERNPDKTIITFDDDILYPSGWLKGLLRAQLNYPNFQIAYRGQFIQKEVVLTPDIYFNSKIYAPSKIEKLHPKEIILTGVFGVAYPPHQFCSIVVDMERAISLSPGNDDLWLYFNSIHSSIDKIVLPNPFGEPLYFFGSQENALWKQNDAGSKRNGEAITKLTSYFGEYRCRVDCTILGRGN